MEEEQEFPSFPLRAASKQIQCKPSETKGHMRLFLYIYLFFNGVEFCYFTVMPLMCGDFGISSLLSNTRVP